MFSNMRTIKTFLLAQLKFNKTATIKVAGISMVPFLHEGDSVEISSFPSYIPGDILVFFYKEELLIHRLLSLSNEYFFCKGDNSLRLENLTIDDIVGKVIRINNQKVVPPPPFHIELSYLVNREFRRCGYDIYATKKSGIYRFYTQRVHGTEDSSIRYSLREHRNNLDIYLYEPDHSRSELDKQLLEVIQLQCGFNELKEIVCNTTLVSEREKTTYIQDFLAKYISLGLITVI